MIPLLHSFFCFHAWSADLEVLYLRSLAKARSASELQVLQENYSSLKVAQTACEIQLNERSVPAACYETLALEAQFSVKESAEEHEAKIRRLDRLCAAAAGTSRLSIETLSISRKCAESVEAARAIQIYRDEEAADWSKF